MTRSAEQRLGALAVAAGALLVGMGAWATESPPATPDYTKAPVVHPRDFQPDRFAGRAGRYYLENWGVDGLSVKLVESGELVRFSYTVRNATRAAPLNDKRNSPTLFDPQAGVSLSVPQMEKVGQLRQTAPPQANRSYWVAFSNKGRPVKRGDRVDVVIGPFHATNLVVD